MAAKVKALLQWCKVRCDGYRDVQITNFTSSFKSGLAFCAIIHRYRPDLIDYDSLRQEDVYENNKLAFQVAQDELGIAALLDAEDMVKMRIPDKLCIVTYVSQYHNYFRDKEPATGGATKRIAAKRPPQPERNGTAEPQNSKKPAPPKVLEEVDVKGKPGLKREYGDTCSICKDRVFLLERHIEDNKLYHRRCFRELGRSQLSASLKRGLQASEAFANQGKQLEENKENIKKPRTSAFSGYSTQTANSSQSQKSGQQQIEDAPNPFREELEAKGLMYTAAASPLMRRQPNGTSPKPHTPANSHKASSQSVLPNISTVQSTSDKSQPSSGMSYSSRLSSINDDQMKNSLLQNLSRIRQTQDSDKPWIQTKQDSANRKSALAVNLDIFPKKDSSKPSTSPHKVGLQSPQGYKSIFGDSNLSLVPKGSATSEVKPVLKSLGDSDKQSAGLGSRSILKSELPDTSSSSPPKSILKYGQDTSPRDIFNRNRTSSPEGPRSILKSNGRSSSPERSMSPRSILKKGGDDDSDIELPRPILRKASEDIDLDTLVEANLPSRPILKKHSVDKSDDELPKPILKHVTEADKNKSASNNTPFRPFQSASILAHRPAGKTNERVGPTLGLRATQPNNASGEPVKPMQNGRTVLNSFDKISFGASKPLEGKDKAGTVSGGSETVPAWQLEAQKRQYARGNQYEDPEKKQSVLQNDHQAGDRSSTSSTDRFLRNYGVFFGDARRTDEKIDSTNKPKGPMVDKQTTKTDVHAPKRGATDLNLLPKSNDGHRKSALETNSSNDKTKWKKQEENKDKNASSNLTNGSETRPAWQIEVERRRALRNGHYPDPEKDPASVISKLKSTIEPKSDLSGKGTAVNSGGSTTKSLLSNQNDREKTFGQTGLNSNATKPNSIATRPNVLQPRDYGIKNDLKKDTGPQENNLNRTSQPKYPYGSNNTGGNNTTKAPFSYQNPQKKDTVFHTISLSVNNTPKTETWVVTPGRSSNSTSASNSSTSSESSPGGAQSPFSAMSPTGKKPFGAPARTGSPLSPSYKSGNTASSAQRTSTWTTTTTSSSFQIRTTSPLASPSGTTAPNTTWLHNASMSPSPAASSAPLPCRTDSPFSDKSSRSSPLSSPRSMTPTSPSHKTLPGSPTNVSYPTSYGVSKLLNDSRTLPNQRPNQFNSSGRDPAEKYRIATGLPVLGKEQSSPDDNKIYDNATKHIYQSMSKGSTWKSNTTELITHFGGLHKPSETSPTDTYSVSNFQRRTPALQPAPGTSAYLAREPQRRKVGIEKPFFFSRNEFDVTDSTYNELDRSKLRSPAPEPPSIPARSYGMTGRPLPPVPRIDNRRRTISAEERIPPELILRRLENLDGQLRQLEEEGRQLEIKLRECEDDALENELLTAWFDLVNKKNGLVRDEVDLVYKQRQQELEDIHEELEYELRLLLEKPGYMKTASDKVREEALLQELLHTVSERNSIIDSMEEDRLRYREEDEVIAKVMRVKLAEGYGICTDEEETQCSGKKKSKKKKKKSKKNKSKKKKKEKEE